VFGTSQEQEAQDPFHVYTQDDNTANPAALGLATVLLEPDGSISDIFGVAKDPISGHLFLAFMSDPEGISTAPGSQWFQTAVTWFGDPALWRPAPEALLSGVPGNANLYVNPNLGAVLATFTSDADVVPEPTTVLAGVLLLLPFGASTLRILRKNRKA